MTGTLPFVLAADVGGTNTRLALCAGTIVDTATVRRFPNAGFDSLTDVLRAYRQDFDAPVSAACVAVAGPVRNGVGRLTNRDWQITADALCEATGAAEGYVINDLAAQGYALDHVEGQAILGPGLPDDGTRLVVGVGTGFNASPVYRTPAGSHVVASEAGHVSLPVWDARSLGLAETIIRHHSFASVEEVLSGRGLLQVHRFCAGPQAEALKGAEILGRAAQAPDGTEAAAAELMTEILGRVVGDLALIHLPDGGVFLVGGMARALRPWLMGPSFSRGYLDKGRFSDFLRTFPVALVEDDYAALTGCADYVARAG
ncbi:MAG: glucokinase [Pseudomonadota bacterium]